MDWFCDFPTCQAAGSTRLIVPESSAAGNDNSPQKKSLCQKATPPPSPLLSELLKKGSILATKSRLVREGELARWTASFNSVMLNECGRTKSILFVFQIEDGDVSVGNMTGSHDLQLAPPLSQASGASKFILPGRSICLHCHCATGGASYYQLFALILNASCANPLLSFLFAQAPAV